MNTKPMMTFLVVFLLILGLAFTAQAETKSLMMATTTSTEDTGLLDYLMPLF